MDLPTALTHEVGHRPGREHPGAGVPTETVGAGTWRGPGADGDRARFVDAFSALLATEEEPSGIGGGPISRIRKEVLTSESGRWGPYRQASRRRPGIAPAPG